ncbi:MAG TPA: penicillin-binding protein 1C [Pseudolabrys sp.]|nr:penicillin-binding protein 1C [Pseudolabrys sp.]
MKRRRIIGAGLGAAALAAAVGCAAFVYALGPPPLGKDLPYSHVVLDRHGKLLRAYATPEGRWRLPVAAKDVDPRFLKLLFAYEDKRFWSHRGVDAEAMVRAAFQFATTGHIVSGGSTITMQVARLLEPRRERSLEAKLRQMTRALEIEQTLDKGQILSLYLTLAPYGGNLEGVRAASLAYFGKEPRKLSLAEAALLVALPQSPELRRPDRFAKAARAARDRVLDRVAAAGVVPRDEIARAKAIDVPHARKELPVLAPHSSDRIVAAEPGRFVHRLTVDGGLQRALEDLAHDRARALGPQVSTAIVAADIATGEVLARVGSADFFDAARAGQVDMTRALRSPGSTLKPFIYGMGFEDGLIHPETLIDDKPIRFGNYKPENFDQSFQGTVTVRRALQFSLNVPAIAVLDKVGVTRLNARLSQAGAVLVLPSGEAPGLAMGLGGVGVRLNDLVMLYTGLARLGSVVPLTDREGETPAPIRLLDPVAAWYIGNILIGAPPPDNAAPGRIAYKTGTSYGYRDAWAIGFDGRICIGVWVGRPDGAPVPGLIGRATAAPILFDAFARSGHAPAALPRAPKGAVLAPTDKLPPPLQRFAPGGSLTGLSEPPRIMFPPDGARLELSGGETPDPLALKIAGGRGPLTVMVNGVPLPAQAGGRRTYFFTPDGPGFARLTVMDARGASDSVTVRLQ